MKTTRVFEVRAKEHINDKNMQSVISWEIA